jgi:hypothetical protein
MEKFLNKDDNILTKDASTFQEVKNKVLNLYSAGRNGDSAHHIFGNMINKHSKTGTKSFAFGTAKPPPSIFKDIAITIMLTWTNYNKNLPSKASGHS